MANKYIWSGDRLVVGGIQRTACDTCQYPSLTFSLNTTYTEKTQDCDAARNDPMSFYHGMNVFYGGKCFVLTGPPVDFVEGCEEQPGLFGEA